MSAAVARRGLNEAAVDHGRLPPSGNGNGGQKWEAKRQLLQIAQGQPTQYGCALPEGDKDVTQEALPEEEYLCPLTNT